MKRAALRDDDVVSPQARAGFVRLLPTLLPLSRCVYICARAHALTMSLKTEVGEPVWNFGARAAVKAYWVCARFRGRGGKNTQNTTLETQVRGNIRELTEESKAFLSY